MTPASPWFDRTFELGRRDEEWPPLLQRLRSTPDRIAALLEGVGHDALTRRHAGRWSLLENVGHLHDLEALSERRLDDFEHASGLLSPADLENRATWDANHNARPEGEVLAGFRAARDRLVARLDSLPDDVRARTIEHPRLHQPMRVVDLMYFMAEHDDHHLSRLRELLAAADRTIA